MKRAFRSFLLLGLLSGCAGYAIDYTKPKASIIGAELARYGFGAAQSQCLGERLSVGLSVWQLRQLQISASSVTDPKRLTAGDFLWVAKSVKDARVGPEVQRAAEACKISAAAVAAPQPVAEAPRPAPTPARPAATTWGKLGAAQSGQSIAGDASSLAEEGSYRSGWFRLTNPGEQRGNSSYLLRVDCTARTINSMAVRKHGADGSISEERSFGPNGEGASAIENGTVMQIAFLALCT